MKNVRSFQLRHRTNFEISRPGKFKILQFHSGFALAHILSFHDDIILRNIFYCVRRRRTHTFTRRSRVYRRDAIRFQGFVEIERTSLIFYYYQSYKYIQLIWPWAHILPYSGWSTDQLNHCKISQHPERRTPW